MSYDPYADCPCGSGKKIKFCCQEVIPGMQKVARLRENQPSRALQILDELEDKHPDNLWVAASHSRLLMEVGDYQSAKRRTESFLNHEGNDARNPELNAIHALASFVCDGFESSKRSVHRAFQLSARREPSLLTRLAGAIAMVMLEAESFMAARAHAALAVKLSPEDRRQHFVMQLAQIEGSSRIPYPLRSVHRLVPYTAAVEDQPDFDRAMRLSSLGCWHPAAILLKRIADKHPDAAELWHNLGLCHAWDGNEPVAAEAFHKAAELYADHEAAVECETLAQLLDLELTEDVNEIAIRSFKAQSVSRLLTQLDGEEQFERLTIEVSLDDDGPVAQYRLLERPFPRDRKPEELTPDDIPEFIADIFVFDQTDDGPAQVQLSGVEGEGFDQAQKALLDAVGDLLEEDTEADDEALGVVPRELEGLEWNCHFPADFPSTIARDIETAKMQQVADEIWPNISLSALGGKTPLDARGDESLRVPLEAAVYVLDAFYDRNNVMLDVSRLRESLGLADPAPLIPGDSVTGFSTIALQRIPFAELSDDQLVDIARRLFLVRHTRTTYEAFTVAARRPECVERLEKDRVYAALVGICREQNLRGEALEWLQAGRDAAVQDEAGFEVLLEWDVRELNLRMDDPEDPAIPELWKKFEETYLPKLPELREGIVEVMREKGLGHLISEVTPVAAGGGETVWTPGSDEPGPDESRKLWVPGQD